MTTDDIENSHFMGARIGDMDRDGLLEVLRWFADQHAQQTSPERSRAYALGRVEMLKRGEAGAGSGWTV